MRKPIYSAEWIYKLEPKRRWELYWMQQKIMEPYISLEDNLLELGVGSGFCSNYLKSKGYSIETIDIDAEKSPDILCDITEWEPRKKYDGFISFQVFEHMYFENFEEIILKLSEMGVKYLYVSVPHNSMSKHKLLQGHFFMPKLRNQYVEITWPFWKPAKITCESHMWELDDGSVSTKMYYDVFKKNGYERILNDKMYYAIYNVFKLKK